MVLEWKRKSKVEDDFGIATSNPNSSLSISVSEQDVSFVQYFFFVIMNGKSIQCHVFLLNDIRKYGSEYILLFYRKFGKLLLHLDGDTTIGF